MSEASQESRPTILPSDQVERYLATEFGPQLKWYEEESARLEHKVTQWTWAGIGSGVLATILAACPNSLLLVVFRDGQAVAGEVIKWLVVAVTAIASTANGVLVPRYRRMATSREKGRIKTALHAKLAAIELGRVPMTEAERAQWLILAAHKLMDIEAEHGGLVHGTAGADSPAPSPS